MHTVEGARPIFSIDIQRALLNSRFGLLATIWLGEGESPVLLGENRDRPRSFKTRSRQNLLPRGLIPCRQVVRG
jgi:hypothetical protein